MQKIADNLLSEQVDAALDNWAWVLELIEEELTDVLLDLAQQPQLQQMLPWVQIKRSRVVEQKLKGRMRGAHLSAVHDIRIRGLEIENQQQATLCRR